MGDKYLSKETARITISYNGKEKKIPLIVQPSPQLSDAQAQSALESVTRLVQQIFKIVDSRNFTLRDSFSYYNKLTKNSFRQVDFPLKWNVVFDKKESDETMLRHGGVVRPIAVCQYCLKINVLWRTLPFIINSRYASLYSNATVGFLPSVVVYCSVICSFQMPAIHWYT